MAGVTLDLSSQTLICSDDKILGTHTSTWAVDQFFYDMAQLPRGSIYKAAEAISRNDKKRFQKLEQRVNDLEKQLAKVLYLLKRTVMREPNLSISRH